MGTVISFAMGAVVGATVMVFVAGGFYAALLDAAREDAYRTGQKSRDLQGDESTELGIVS